MKAGNINRAQAPHKILALYIPRILPLLDLHPWAADDHDVK